MNEAILLSNMLQRKLNNDYRCQTKKDNFLLSMFSLQFHINITEHMQRHNYFYHKAISFDKTRDITTYLQLAG